MTQTTWERGRMYLCGGRKFVYYDEALTYARFIFKTTGIIVGIESVYSVEK